MPACIIQQLFRQIVGQDVDPCLVDDVLFTMLRSRKELSRELSQDIKLVNKIMGEGRFTVDFIVGAFRPSKPSKPSPDKRVRRSQIHRSGWTSIDILNGLRELKQPAIGGHRYTKRGLVGDRFAYLYINFIEAPFHTSTKEEITELVNDFLVYTLNNDRFLKWGESILGGYDLSLHNDSTSRLRLFHEE
jgi:hypothetical protein